MTQPVYSQTHLVDDRLDGNGLNVEITTPFRDPLLELSDRLHEWFASPHTTTVLRAMGMEPPLVGITAFNQREQILNQAPPGQGRANRVLLIPGSWPDGENQGNLVPVKRPKGLLHRVNATWERIFVLSCWASDPTDPSNFAKQLQAASSLQNTAHAGLRAVLRGDLHAEARQLRDPKASNNIGFGLEILLELTFDCEMRALPVAMSGTPVNVNSPKPT